MHRRNVGRNHLRKQGSRSAWQSYRSRATAIVSRRYRPFGNPVALIKGRLMAGNSSGISLEERLRQFVQRSAGQDFDWAERNCGFWVCEWIEHETGRDPVAEYRG